MTQGTGTQIYVTLLNWLLKWRYNYISYCDIW